MSDNETDNKIFTEQLHTGQVAAGMHHQPHVAHAMTETWLKYRELSKIIRYRVLRMGVEARTLKGEGFT
jgi:hypothetical protein